jgi:pilus assembly protein Flp/PilA
VFETTEEIEMKRLIVNFLRDERGLTTVEYAVAGGLIALAVVVAFTNLGAHVGRVITDIDTKLP